MSKPTWLPAFYRGLLVLTVLLVGLFSQAEGAIAHPLGNFTINHFARLSIQPEQASVQYVVDMAEIPAFQALQAADTNGDKTTSATELNAYLEQLTPRYAQGLALQVDEQTVPLQVKTKAASLPPGMGGLPTLRLEWQLVGVLPSSKYQGSHRLSFGDRNDPTRIGWREIVVDPNSPVSVFNSSAYSNSLTDALRSYPQDLLTTPLEETATTLSFTQGAIPDGATPLLSRGGEPVNPNPLSTLASLMTSLKTMLFTPNYQRVPLLPDFDWESSGGMMVAIAAAFFWGAMHSLTPGHGKTIVGAYLVGSRATVQHALFLAATTTITHTIGVFALGCITLFATHYILPEQLYPWLNLLSGAMVAAIGFTLLRQRLQTASSNASTPHSHPYAHHHHPHPTDISPAIAHPHPHSHPHPHPHSHPHPHPHSHDHSHNHSHPHRPLTSPPPYSPTPPPTHSHLPPGADDSALTWRSLLALGISGGLLPCPAALVLLLGAIALGKITVGLVLVVAFSLGLASVLTSLGLLLIYAKPWFKHLPAEWRSRRGLPAISALCITLLGLGISTRALFEMGM